MWYNGGMSEGQVIQGITGGILAIVGILLAIISSGIWFRRVKIRIGFLGIGLALSGVGLFILITSFPQYAIGFSVLATLALAFAAFLTIKEANTREERRRKENLLKEIAKWSADVRKYCASLDIGFNTQLERSQAAEKYLTLKFDGENLLIAVEKETLGDNLQGFLRSATQLFDGKSWSSLADNKEKRQQLETICENVTTMAFELLRKQ